MYTEGGRKDGEWSLARWSKTEKKKHRKDRGKTGEREEA